MSRQQHRDPTKWYDGLFSVYDMRAKVLRSPDDTDGFDYWWGYVVAADDPVLGKAPFLASKNVRFPDAEEIRAIDVLHGTLRLGEAAAHGQGNAVSLGPARRAQLA